MKKHQIPQ